VGQNGTQRLPLLKQLLCAQEDTLSESHFEAQVLPQVSTRLGAYEVAVHDAGAAIADMQTAHMPRFVVRLDRNCTARRNQLPAHHGGRGRPLEYGALVRPLARTYKGHLLLATVADLKTQYTYEGHTIRVRSWRDVVRSEQKVAADNAHFTIWIYDDPLYRAPRVLSTNVAASPTTIFQLYLDRWPVEEVPLVCKPLLGLQVRVCGPGTLAAPRARPHRRQYLGAFGGGVTCPAHRLLDRQPRHTPGRLRRVLGQAGFPTEYPLEERIREKHAVTAHLPKGAPPIAGIRPYQRRLRPRKRTTASLMLMSGSQRMPLAHTICLPHAGSERKVKERLFRYRTAGHIRPGSSGARCTGP
jgi:hypothetical protein